MILWIPFQSFAVGIQSSELPSEILRIQPCIGYDTIASTYVFQGKMIDSKTADKSMDNYKKKNIYLKISNLDYLLDSSTNITKGNIVFIQPNATTFSKGITIDNTYTMYTNYLDDKPRFGPISYLENECKFKAINLKGTITMNPASKIITGPNEFKLKLTGIPNINTTTQEIKGLKEIQGSLQLGITERSIDNIMMDISCIKP